MSGRITSNKIDVSISEDVEEVLRKNWGVDDLVGGDVSKEDLLNWGFEEGSTVLYERGGDRVAFTVLAFSSSEGAKEVFDGVTSSVGEKHLYSTFFPIPAVGKSLGVYSEDPACDQALFQKDDLLALVTVGGEDGARREDSLPYARLFEERIG